MSCVRSPVLWDCEGSQGRLLQLPGTALLCQDDDSPWIGSGLGDATVSHDTEELLALPEEGMVQHACTSALLEFQRN